MRKSTCTGLMTLALLSGCSSPKPQKVEVVLAPPKPVHVTNAANNISSGIDSNCDFILNRQSIRMPTGDNYAAIRVRPGDNFTIKGERKDNIFPYYGIIERKKDRFAGPAGSFGLLEIIDQDTKRTVYAPRDGKVSIFERIEGWTRDPIKHHIVTTHTFKRPDLNPDEMIQTVGVGGFLIEYLTFDTPGFERVYAVEVEEIVQMIDGKPRIVKLDSPCNVLVAGGNPILDHATQRIRVYGRDAYLEKTADADLQGSGFSLRDTEAPSRGTMYITTDEAKKDSSSAAIQETPSAVSIPK